MNDRPAVLKNNGPRHNAVAIVLTGTRSNRSAIGARCVVEAGDRKQMNEVMSGGSFYSQNSMTLYFGLGSADKVDRIEVRWPSGATQSWHDVAVNRTWGITEGSDAIRDTRWAQR